MEPLQIIFLLLAGLLAGFINTLAGGGSVLSILALLFAGLDSTIANATNRVAVFLQCATGSAQFYRNKLLDPKEALILALPALAGAVVGTFIAMEIDKEVFDKILGGVLILVLVTLFFKPSMWIQEKRRSLPLWIQIPIFFAIGIYGGFIQAGVGFFLLIALSLVLGYDLVKANALKVAIVFLYTALSLAIFAFSGMVVWLFGIILAAGNVVGAYLGVRFAVKRGAKQVRWILVAAVILSSLKLFDIVQF
jgi:uncharacterized membrane protein YfcA